MKFHLSIHLVFTKHLLSIMDCHMQLGNLRTLLHKTGVVPKPVKLTVW